MILRTSLFILFVLPLTLFSQPKLNIVGGTSLNFGEVYSSMPVKHLVTIRNTGIDTLKIWDVSGSCGCTGTMMSNDHIAPGDSGTLEISFDPATFTGVVEKVISMKSNDTAHAKMRLSFTADVKRVLDVSPNYVVFKGVVGTTSIDTIILSNRSPDVVRLTSVVASTEDLVVQPVKSTIQPNETLEIICRYSPKKSGTVKGTIVVSTDHPHLPSLNIRYFSLVRSTSSAPGSH